MNGPINPFQPHRAPSVTVARIGHQFAATILRRRDGVEYRLQVFDSPAAAALSARLLNQAFAEARS